jgi:glycosyltransferase involved in cell wall biosynthesis
VEIPKQKDALSKAQELASQTMSGIQKLNPFYNPGESGSLKAPFASLCVLSYERPEVLADSLASLEQHTNYPYEIIIHDDGSQEGMVNEYLWDMRNEGATVIYNPPGHNQGQGVALNRMFNMAKGDPIIKLDADLLYRPGWLLETARLLHDHPQIGLLGLLHYYHDPVDTHKTVIERQDDYSTHTHILGSGFALRRETWEQLKPFEEGSEAFSEDWDMQMRVTDSKEWACALPLDDLVKNEYMGYETSTVNKTVAGEMPQIKKGPYVHAWNENLKLD